VVDRLFADNFKLDEWLDQQGVPPPILAVSQSGPSAGRQSSYAAVGEREADDSGKMENKAFLVLAETFEQTGKAIPAHAKTVLGTTEVVTVGRQPGVSLLIDHDSVSRRHAEISYNNRRYILRDTGSSNGTFVNKTRLPAGAVYVLQDGEYIRFGKISYVFLREEPAKAAQSQATVLRKTRLSEHATGFYDPGAHEVPSESAQPLLNADGSLLLPGAREAIPASEVAGLKLVPALVAIIQGHPRICHLQAGKVISLGRDKQNELPLPDMSASRRHAEVFYGQDGFYLRDLGSSNGVHINRTRIDNPYRLAHGDRIQIGGTTIFFLQPDAQEEIPTARSAANFICIVCGAPITREAHFCTHCGTTLTQSALSKA
jgi:pSer/pThr/pTyr-binding forkhead associated (FHA) protein